ncbi:hypothetical protein RclHR1_00280029 [Rhizophagus clarus]|uniref:Uncharacterized protein n=1 Tax=Rhizophagus clarus TaxID=94130 RepID=A0A2Z6R2L9_9GLOM|nr:hypothetical protein RclHR1_00280029 [Rhizophagus clarus]GES83749.1 hypothetical protein GLOIN_2v1844572 [Rhizophagus clarus]
MQNISQDSQNYQDYRDYDENLTECIQNPLENNNNNNIFTATPNSLNDYSHENESTVSVPSTHFVTPNFQSTSRTASHQSNIPFMYQKFQRISNSIIIFEENAKRQLEQVYELKDHLSQLKQFFNTQQQQHHPITTRRVNRNRDYRTHPYLNERHYVSPHMSTATETDRYYKNENELDFMNDQNISLNRFRLQQSNVPTAIGFSNNNKILSTSPQNFEFHDPY